MSRHRDNPTGLLPYVYERYGLRTYSIGFKPGGKAWAWRERCAVDDRSRILELRRQANERAAKHAAAPQVDGTFAWLADQWQAWQDSKPVGSEGRRAESTLAENKRELVPLKKAFGAMLVASLVKPDAYAYLDACEAAGRPAKGNKEISLAREVLEYGIRKGVIQANPFADVRKLVTVTTARYVTDAELELVVEVGRTLRPQQHLVALALKTAWLCVRRSVEVRALERSQLGADGIEWTAAKRKRGAVAKEGLMAWSPELRATIDEAVAVPRNKLVGSFVFGNLAGERYTKGGWKATLAVLMRACEAEAKRRGVPFAKFSLQDCRPKGVTDKLDAGHTDVMAATLHTSERMIKQTYDRRTVVRSTPTK